MSTLMDEAIKRWTATRRSALVVEIFQGNRTIAEASRSCDLPRPEIKSWIGDAKEDKTENQLSDRQSTNGEAMQERRRKCATPFRRGREMIEMIGQGLLDDEFDVSISKLCRWFDMPRIFDLEGWQVRCRPIGLRPRAQLSPSIADRPNGRWAVNASF